MSSCRLYHVFYAWGSLNFLGSQFSSVEVFVQITFTAILKKSFSPFWNSGSLCIAALEADCLLRASRAAQKRFCVFTSSRWLRTTSAGSMRRRCGPASTSSTLCGPWAWSRTWPCPPSLSSGTRARARAPCWRLCRESPSPGAAVRTESSLVRLSCPDWGRGL